MESSPQKSLERVISQKALQMSSSSYCKAWVVGFLCGACITYLFLVCLSSFRTLEFGVVYSASAPEKSRNYGSEGIGLNKVADVVHLSRNTERVLENYSNAESILSDAELLYSAWNAMLNGSELNGRLNSSTLPRAPHLEDCAMNDIINRQYDSRRANESFPPWMIWKGLLGLEQSHFKRRTKSEGAYPPWIVGSDEENFPLTRKVQRDLWIHQHPLNCYNPGLRFLVTDWERLPGFGIGAQLAGMSGLFAIAINENRVLVTSYFNRADHDGCQGSSRSHWSCYFFLETSIECREYALGLLTNQEAWERGIITGKENYTSKEIWAGRIPRAWGDPWRYLQPTTEIDGTLVMHHRKMDRRWWRAQAVRYLMRFKTRYTCGLLNVARHSAFGMQAAKMVVDGPAIEWPKAVVNNGDVDMEHLVWSDQKPWMPRPLLSMHVRMGDKACEMNVVGFRKYMQLANRIRKSFPNLKDIWLSSEMQEVINNSSLYSNWNFYYTNVTRQVGNLTMAVYEASLGRELSTNYPLVNFLMATEADFFIGALGSTWCYLIDGMRNTGGKVMAGYLSVNKDRFW